MSKELHEQNRLSWNQATRAHNSHKGDQAACCAPVPPVPADETPVTSIEVRDQRPTVTAVAVGAALVAITGFGVFVAGEGWAGGRAGVAGFGAILSAVHAGMLRYLWVRHRDARTRWTLTDEGVRIERNGPFVRVQHALVPWFRVRQVRPSPAAPERIVLTVHAAPGMPETEKLWRGDDVPAAQFSGFARALSRRVRESHQEMLALGQEPPVAAGLTPLTGSLLVGIFAVLGLQFAGVLPWDPHSVIVELLLATSLGTAPVVRGWNQLLRRLEGSSDEPPGLPSSSPSSPPEANET